MKKINTLGPGLMIGIPTLGRPISLDWALSFKGMNPPINYNVTYCVIKGQQVANARNAIAKEAIKAGVKYLFFLGDDVICPPHTLRQLLYRMENNDKIDVVGGVYCSKCEPSAPLVFRGNGNGSYWDWKIGEFFECTGLGMDCTLIRVDSLAKIEEPWFQTIDKDQYLDGINQAEQWTEDLYFLDKVSNVGGSIYCDATVICEHVDIYSGKIYRLPKNSYPMRQKIAHGRKLLMLGPEIELNESYDITRVCDDDQADYRGSIDNLPFEANEFEWVIVTQPMDSFTALDEWKRVSKDKISINIHPWLRIDVIAVELNGTVNGSFIDLRKNGNTQDTLPSDESSNHDNVSVACQ